MNEFIREHISSRIRYCCFNITKLGADLLVLQTSSIPLFSNMSFPISSKIPFCFVSIIGGICLKSPDMTHRLEARPATLYKAGRITIDASSTTTLSKFKNSSFFKKVLVTVAPMIFASSRTFCLIPSISLLTSASAISRGPSSFSIF